MLTVKWLHYFVVRISIVGRCLSMEKTMTIDRFEYEFSNDLVCLMRTSRRP